MVKEEILRLFHQAYINEEIKQYLNNLHKMTKPQLYLESSITPHQKLIKLQGKKESKIEDLTTLNYSDITVIYRLCLVTAVKYTLF